MEFEAVVMELETLGTERTKKIYASHGAREPQFGVATGDMRALAKKIGKNQDLAEKLYSTGNYDCMYFAGMILDPKKMTEADFDRWMEAAYFYMISDYVLAVSLAETDYAQAVADRWINSGRELVMSAGWACYTWLLGYRKDDEFDRDKISAMLDTVSSTIHDSPNRTRYSMNGFVAAVGVSYIPLHEKAVAAAEKIGKVSVRTEKGACSVPVALDEIRKMEAKGKIGFKRKAVRC